MHSSGSSQQPWHPPPHPLLPLVARSSVRVWTLRGERGRVPTRLVATRLFGMKMCTAKARCVYRETF